MFATLNDKFDIAPATEQSTAVVPAQTTAVVEKAAQELKDNDTLSQETLQELVQQGREAVTMMLSIAQNTEHPRAFEVLAQLFKTVADNAKDLLEIEKKRAEINKLKNERSTPSGGTAPRTQNNIFVGSTADLLKAMKAAKAEESIPVADAEVIE